MSVRRATIHRLLTAIWVALLPKFDRGFARFERGMCAAGALCALVSDLPLLPLLPALDGTLPQLLHLSS